ncbi:MAG: dienelactone hydrolase family protein [Planctomycetota bacterium]|nr:dienelactone hydrolase family protein [Planctomycetota bacterium]
MRHALLILVLAAGATAKDEVYRPRAGALAIATARIELPRGEGEKPLRVRVTHPTAKGKYPVIVYSHGMYGSGDAYRPLVDAWAKTGYVFFQPTHPDSRSLGVKARAEAVKAWRVRPQEVALILDSLDAIVKRVPALKGKLDRARIGVGGHSFGAHTSQLVTGVRTRIQRRLALRDKRVKCALLISPQGRGGLFGDDAWKSWTAPALVITGSNDGDPFGDPKKTPQWRLDSYALSPPADKYLLWIDGAHHSFGGISGARRRGSGPKNEKHVALVRDAGLAFFDAYVKGSAGAKAWLRRNTKPRAPATKPIPKPTVK